MAGIGFRIEKLLLDDSYISITKAYVSSAMVAAGPVLCTILSIAIISFIAPHQVSSAQVSVFRTLVVYVFMLTLITTAPMQMVLTRFIADRIYLGDTERIAPAFAAVVAVNTPLNSIVAMLLVPLLRLTPCASVFTVGLVVCISVTWISMVVLSAAKDFMAIFKSYAWGMGLSIFAGYLGGIINGFVGLLAGYTIGQVLLMSFLVAQIFAEFKGEKQFDFAFFGLLKHHPMLIVAAIAYNIGIWIDKIIFWFSGATGQKLQGILYCSPVYDMPFFIASLLIIPTLAMFIIRVETDFYVHYRKYYLAIKEKYSLSAIEEKRKNIVRNLRFGMGKLIVMQITVMAISLFLAPVVYTKLGMTALNLSVFQISIVAAFPLAILQIIFLLLLYFDLQSEAAVLTVIFAVGNAFFSFISIKLGLSYYGYGFFTACFVSLVVGFVLLNAKLKDLTCATFLYQRSETS